MLGWLADGIEVDLETANAIGSLREDIDQRFTAVDQRFNAVDQQFMAVDQRFDAVDQRFDAVDQRITSVEDALRGEIRALREEMRGEMREMREELMRHAMVLTDSVRDDIRIIADGLAAVSAKLDALRH